MNYTQDCRYSFSDEIGENGLDRCLFNRKLEFLKNIQQNLKVEKQQGTSYLNLPSKVDDLEFLQSIADKYRKFKYVIIFGTGGSSLGAECLKHISKITNKSKNSPELYIITNIDPYTYLEKFKKIDLSQAGFIVISKSGKTIETIMQFLTILPILRKYVSEDNFKNIITVITNPKDSPLRKLAKKYELPIIDHDPNLSGRYSVFSVVGILPALIVGLCAKKFRQGANQVLQQTLNNNIQNVPSAISASIIVGLMEYKNINISVLLVYSDRLGSLSRWYRQLWAESLGKNGKGSTPIYAMGPIDQHSQLQLWLDGPTDKFFTVLSTKKDVQTNIIKDNLNDINMGFLQNRSLTDLMQASCFATIDSLKKYKRPIRTIILEEINVETLGAVMMHFILETIFSAALLNINPFNQPAVEYGRKF